MLNYRCFGGRFEESEFEGTSRGSVPLLPIFAPKGVGKHRTSFGSSLGNFVAYVRSFLFQEAYATHNLLSRLNCPSLLRRLDDLSFDELVNVYDFYALHVVVAGNMLANELRPSVEEVDRLGQRCQNVEEEKESLLFTKFNLCEEVEALSFKLKIADLERAEKILDEAAEAFVKLEFPYISLLSENSGKTLGELTTIKPSAL
uniref:Uncharacterized protein n=1 Tax=Tanacetum cinerariifolium TaxID=118510 RepID=A0A6L2P960_TANCI|nr:hypothetical protein [Tanacetum cinerariifolium]